MPQKMSLFRRIFNQNKKVWSLINFLIELQKTISHYCPFKRGYMDTEINQISFM